VIATRAARRAWRRFIELCACELGWSASTWRVRAGRKPGTAPDSGCQVVRIDPRYFRPAEGGNSAGESTKAREKLGWTPPQPWRSWWRRWLKADPQDAARKPRSAVRFNGGRVSMENPPALCGL